MSSWPASTFRPFAPFRPSPVEPDPLTADDVHELRKRYENRLLESDYRIGETQLVLRLLDVIDTLAGRRHRRPPVPRCLCGCHFGRHRCACDCRS